VVANDRRAVFEPVDRAHVLEHDCLAVELEEKEYQEVQENDDGDDDSDGGENSEAR